MCQFVEKSSKIMTCLNKSNEIAHQKTRDNLLELNERRINDVKGRALIIK